MDTASQKTWWIAGAVLLAVLAAGLWLGLEKVPDDQVMVVPGADGDLAAVWEPGWHWRLPWAAEPLPLPRRPVDAATQVRLETREGAAIVLDLEGRLAVADGGVERWVEAAGPRPFLEGVSRVVADALTRAGAVSDPAAIFEESAARELASTARSALEAAGLAVEALTLSAPLEDNPVAAAVARSRVAGLADPTGLKVLVVGWDGADWLMIRPLLAAGRLPHLARLVEGGVSGELRSEEPLLSPLLWTTIATGKPVAEHGVADFLVTDPATGEPVPISSASRRVHALWTLLGAFDLTSEVVAWWATWPAERVQGTMVTDRVAYQLLELGEDAGDAEGKVYPESAWPRVEAELVAADEVPFSEVARFVDVPEAELARRWQALPAERRQEDPVNHLRKILATTRSYHRVALDLLAEQADLTMVYYEGTDTVGHRFAHYLPPRMDGVSGEDVARYGETLPRFYEWADELLGELLAAVDEDTLVLLVSDHGFFTGRARPESDPSDFAGGAPHWHRLFGVLVADGPGISRGEVEEATIFDVAPTVLAALGLPVAEDMPGKVLTPLLPPAARRSLESRTAAGGERLASYEVLPRARPRAVRDTEADEERLRELVALGYLSQAELEERTAGARAEGGAGANGGAGAGGDAALQARATEAYNLGRIAQREGRLAEAERHYRTAVERMPGFGTAWASLAQVEAQQGDGGAAFDVLVEGFQRSGDMPPTAVSGLVDLAAPVGRLDDAESVLEGLRPSLAGTSAYQGAWGLLYEKRGDSAAALAAYDRALAVDPLDPLAVEQKLGLLRRLGRGAEARSFLEERSRRASSVSDMARLALSALRQGRPDVAEGLLRRVLESDPGNPAVLGNLSTALAQQGELAEASDVMRQAIRRDPGNPQRHFNLGAMLAAQGRTGEALAAFEEAEALGARTPQLHVAMSKMRFQLGDPPGAERELRRALEIDPGNAEARQLLAVLESGGP